MLAKTVRSDFCHIQNVYRSHFREQNIKFLDILNQIQSYENYELSVYITLIYLSK